MAAMAAIAVSVILIMVVVVIVSAQLHWTIACSVGAGLTRLLAPQNGCRAKPQRARPCKSGQALIGWFVAVCLGPTFVSFRAHLCEPLFGVIIADVVFNVASAKFA